MEQRGDAVFDEPLLVSNTGTILDGYSRWTLARQQGRSHILCVEYAFTTEDEAFRFLIQRQLARHEPLNAFSRVALALELEPVLREKARERQMLGGQKKLPSDLTKAGQVDVRSEIAKLAKVSTGNVTKVKQLLQRGCPELRQVLLEGQVSINLAHKWIDKPHSSQRWLLQEWHGGKDLYHFIRRILARHRKQPGKSELMLPELVQLLTERGAALKDVQVHVLKDGEKGIFITPDILFKAGNQSRSERAR